MTRSFRPPLPFLLALPLLLTSLLPACGASAQRTHLVAALATQTTIEETCEVVRVTRRDEAIAAQEASSDRQDAIVNVALVRERWEPAVEACLLAAHAHQSWATAIHLAMAQGDELSWARVAALARSVVNAVVALRELLARTPIPIPEIPPELLAFAGVTS